MSSVLVSALAAWAPGVVTSDEWKEWAAGKRQIECSASSPTLKDFTTSLFRRRLSQISRMTIQVVHDTLLAATAEASQVVQRGRPKVAAQEGASPRVLQSSAKNSPKLDVAAQVAQQGSRPEFCRCSTDQGGKTSLAATAQAAQEGDDKMSNIPLVFVSNRGELARELAISQMLAVEHEVLPASFSLSVFNAPIALAAIALGLHGAYTAVYPAGGNFGAAFTVASSRVTSHRCNKVLLSYADEMICKEYASLPDATAQDGGQLEPLAFACIISRCEGTAEEGGRGVVVKTNEAGATATGFLRHLIASGALDNNR